MERPGKPARKGAGSDSAAIHRRAGPYIDASWQFIASMVLLTLLGRWADGRFGLTPWLTVAGALFGFSSGLYVFLRVILNQSEREKREREEAGTKSDDVGPKR